MLGWKYQICCSLAVKARQAVRSHLFPATGRLTGTSTCLLGLSGGFKQRQHTSAQNMAAVLREHPVCIGHWQDHLSFCIRSPLSARLQAAPGGRCFQETHSLLFWRHVVISLGKSYCLFLIPSPHFAHCSSVWMGGQRVRLCSAHLRLHLH